MTLKLTNNATALLAGSITDSDTEISLATGKGSLFPTLSEEGDWFPVIVIDASGNVEIMRATARSGDVLTVTRAQEGTSARAFDAGARLDLRLSAAAVADIIDDLETLMTTSIASAVTDLEGKLSAANDASLIFPQDTTETGWEQDTDFTDRVLRVVSGEGGGTGGSWTISGLTVNGTALSASQGAVHSHSGSTDTDTHNHSVTGANNTNTTNNQGGQPTAREANRSTSSDSHNHGLNINNSAGGSQHAHGLSADGNWRPAYFDVIRGIKQAA